ncbi:MAG: hypothetical protein SNF68_08255 [Rikenellaceae bacterium]
MRLFLPFALLSLVACVSSPVTSKSEATDLFSYGEAVAQIQPLALNEISGMVESDTYPQHFWVHNDSGDDPNIYLINLRGELVATVELDAINIDWEDIAIHNSKIYVGEIGDNNTIHPCKKIYRIDEPQVDTTHLDATIKSSRVETMQLNFADTKRDCETLMVDPLSGDLLFVTKREDWVFLYQTPFIATSASEEILVKRTGQLQIHEATGGDISRDGVHILIKNYDKIYYYTRDIENETLSQALSKRPITLPYQREPQGEAIAWSHDSNSFYTISEKSMRSTEMPHIYRYTRR